MNLLPPFSQSKLPCPMSAWFLFLVTWLSLLNCLASAGFEQQQDGVNVFEALLGNTGESLPQLANGVVGSQHLTARQLNATFDLNDNSSITREIAPANIDYWTFSPSRLNVTAGSSLYLTLSVCTQPFPRPGVNATEVYTSQTLPPLQLYVSTDVSNTHPGPGVDSTTQAVSSTSQGFANFTISSISSDVHLSIVSSNTTSDWLGSWTYSLGSSTFGIQFCHYSTDFRSSANCDGRRESICYRYFSNGCVNNYWKPIVPKSTTLRSICGPRESRLRFIQSVEFILRLPLKSIASDEC